MLEILPQVDSTNRYLRERAAANGSACLAEAQPEGRGRRGRSWVATPGANLMLSLCRYFPADIALGGLSLAAGVAVCRALEELGVAGVGLKWPNDILWQGRKLAGLLIETDRASDDAVRVITGVGINGYIAPEHAALIDQPWIDLAEITKNSLDRNYLAVLTIYHLLQTSREYMRGGFASFHAEWEQRHVFQNQVVRVLGDRHEWEGVAIGANAQGALRLRLADGSERAVHAGEVSVRVLTMA